MWNTALPCCIEVNGNNTFHLCFMLLFMKNSLQLYHVHNILYSRQDCYPIFRKKSWRILGFHMYWPKVLTFHLIYLSTFSVVFFQVSCVLFVFVLFFATSDLHRKSINQVLPLIKILMTYNYCQDQFLTSAIFESPPCVPSGSSTELTSQWGLLQLGRSAGGGTSTSVHPHTTPKWGNG